MTPSDWTPDAVEDPVDEERFDERIVERALSDLDDDAARTGAACSEEDVDRAAERHSMSVVRACRAQAARLGPRTRRGEARPRRVGA